MSEHHGSASGKVILCGEHAVVYGVPGVAAGISRGAHAHVVPAISGPSSLTLGDRTLTNQDDDDLARAFAALLAVAPPPEPVRVVARAEIPPGGGLGCSAALGVAMARALESQLGHGRIDEARVAERATAWERIFHGNPSGIDTAAAIAGSFLWFERGKGTEPIEAPCDVWLAVGFSGSGASTKTMVESIARIKDTNPALFQKFLEGVRAISSNVRLALSAGDARSLGQLFEMNQMLLALVMLSTEAIETMIRGAKEVGALGAKLTGSGGGGSVIALGGVCPRAEQSSPAEAQAERVAAAWTAAGFPAFATCIRAKPNPRGAS